ncbi:MAG: ABC-type transport auxiliary lipoprotein family protein [Puniceicoccales bacterium]|jgi:uncharacterized lipoprotein YmbA|nr:ABC-type transport auxiliary lipoprotein family protein [Puniceicoccales bacterium]
MRIWNIIGPFFSAAASMALCGCLSIGGKPQQSNVRFFVLGKASDGTATRQENFIPECVVAIARVAIPGHLDRQQIVMQQDGGRISVLDSSRWGEPLADGVGGVLRRAIEKQLPQDLVICAPWDCTVRPYFTLYPAIDDLILTDKSVRVRAHCEFWDCECKKLLGVKRYDAAVPRRGSGIDEAVWSIGRLLEEFGDSIGEDLRRMQSGELDVLTEKQQDSYQKTTHAEPDGIAAAAPLEQTIDRRPMALPREIVIEAKNDSYVTVDDLISGRRIFSSRMRTGQVRRVQRDGPVCVSASNADSIVVCGKSVEKFNCGEL